MPTLEQVLAEIEIPEAYKEYLRRTLSPIERLFDALTGIDERLDYTNALLITLLKLLGGITVPIAPPRIAPRLVAPPIAPPIPSPLLPVEGLDRFFFPVGVPIFKTRCISTNATTFQSILEYETPQDFELSVFEISLSSNNFPQSRFKVKIAQDELLEDEELPNATSFFMFEGCKVKGGEKIIIQGRSTDATVTVKVWGMFSARKIYKG